MDYDKIDIYTNSEAIYPLTAMLSGIISNGFEIHSSADFNDFLENKEMNWDYLDDSLMNLKNVKTHITLYLSKDAQGAELMNALKGALNEIKENDSDNFYGSLSMEINSVKREDWENNWKQYYKPFDVGKSLIIKPTWENVTNARGRKILEIDPASSFGTGQHYTTCMAMELLEREIHGGEKILDLGCGSGILSIAALLLGAKKAVMTDILENSVKTARANALQNGFGKDRCLAFCGDIIKSESLRKEIGTGYDVIAANIVADVIISMSAFFKDFLKKSGMIIISGIICERFDEVKRALEENDIKLKDYTERGGWIAALCSV